MFLYQRIIVRWWIYRCSENEIAVIIICWINTFCIVPNAADHSRRILIFSGIITGNNQIKISVINKDFRGACVKVIQQRITFIDCFSIFFTKSIIKTISAWLYFLAGYLQRIIDCKYPIFRVSVWFRAGKISVIRLSADWQPIKLRVSSPTMLFTSLKFSPDM